MAAPNRRKRRAVRATGAKIGLTVAAVTASVGGWAAFSLVPPDASATFAQAPKTAQTARAPTNTPSLPWSDQAPPTNGALPNGEHWGRRHRTFEQEPGEFNQAPPTDQLMPPELNRAPQADQSTPELNQPPQTDQSTSPGLNQAPQPNQSSPFQLPSRPMARTRSSR